MLVNLLSNAAKFTPPGGALGLQVNGDEAACEVRFAVWDTGIGIAPEDLPRLFQPFGQLDSGLTRHHGGSGLGLILTRRMAELHGGRVEVESAPASGSRFTIILPWIPPVPAQNSPDTATQPVWVSASPAPGQAVTNRLLLLVEDNPTNADAFADYLQGQGFQVILATDGKAAVQEALQQHPALILMDIQMPRMDGLAAIRQLRADPQTAHTPIIAVTALAMPGDRERCIEAGADAYVSKPLGLRQLRNLIDHHLGLV
jgi:CheY-like chemotaxis protein